MLANGGHERPRLTPPPGQLQILIVWPSIPAVVKLRELIVQLHPAKLPTVPIATRSPLNVEGCTLSALTAAATADASFAQPMDTWGWNCANTLGLPVLVEGKQSGGRETQHLCENVGAAVLLHILDLF